MKSVNYFLFMAVFLIAIVLTFSCSSDNENNGEELNSSSSAETNNNLSSSNITSCSSITSSSSTTLSSSATLSSSSSSSTKMEYGSFKTVEIGEQTWMAENHNYEVEGSVCYDNKPANCDKYGRLYDWETAIEICPDGWHLPANEEWVELFRYVSNYDGTDKGWERNTAGRYLKATEGWDNYDGSENVPSIDKSGFEALPGGSYSEGLEDYIEGFKDGFINAGSIGWWWSATEAGDYSAYFYDMFHDDDYIGHGYFLKTALFSVRCVKDE